MLLANLLYLVLGLGFAKVFARISLIRRSSSGRRLRVLGDRRLRAEPGDGRGLVAIAFGFIGFFMRRYGFSPAPLVIGLVLGRMVEETLKQSLLIFDFVGGFLGRPIAMTLFALTALFLLAPLLLQKLRGGRAEPFTMQRIRMENAWFEPETPDAACSRSRTCFALCRRARAVAEAPRRFPVGRCDLRRQRISQLVP